MHLLARVSRLPSYLRLIALALAACATPPTPDDAAAGGDLALGDVEDDGKADGGDPTWGHALECKPVPALPPLAKPRITLSIDGLTLHLVDEAGTYDRVFPVGPGAIDHEPTDREVGESKSYLPVLATGKHDFAITPATIQPCKTWWTDPETGAKSPVFAGLPFLSWSGNFAIHGPIDNFRAANGGSLRRGYVSHGCFRMEAADVLEVYARIKGVASVPVHVQREAERRADGSRVDLDARWIGASCDADAECAYPGGFCAKDAYAAHGTCSAHCTTYCTDRKGYPGTFCVDDPDSTTGQGMCVAKVTAQDEACRPYDALAPKTLARHGQPSVTAQVCAPGSRGWIGDRCLGDADCTNGTTCGTDGTCTQACTRACPDQAGWAPTFCAATAPGATTGACVRQCTPGSHAPECADDEACALEARAGQPSTQKYVCQPAR